MRERGHSSQPSSFRASAARPGNHSSPFSHNYIFLNLTSPKIQVWIPAQGQNEGKGAFFTTFLFPGKCSVTRKPFLSLLSQLYLPKPYLP